MEKKQKTITDFDTQRDNTELKEKYLLKEWLKIRCALEVSLSFWNVVLIYHLKAVC